MSICSLEKERTTCMNMHSASVGPWLRCCTSLLAYLCLLSMSWRRSPCCENGSSVSLAHPAYVAYLMQLYGRRIQLAVALVKYKTRLQKPREGICSAWIARLTPPVRLPIRILSGTLLVPAQSAVPVLAIGPGTGIAPLRAIVQERLGTSPPPANNMVVVGCRYAARDFLFKSEWERLAHHTPAAAASASHDCDDICNAMHALATAAPPIQLFLAASRDQDTKIYVQDVLRAHGAAVWELLGPRRGIAYLSGYAKSLTTDHRGACRNKFAKPC